VDRIHPAFPARLVLTAYSTLSPAIGLVVTVAGAMQSIMPA
jgi:hypothetical protein